MIQPILVILGLGAAALVAKKNNDTQSKAITDAKAKVALAGLTSVEVGRKKKRDLTDRQSFWKKLADGGISINPVTGVISHSGVSVNNPAEIPVASTPTTTTTTTTTVDGAAPAPTTAIITSEPAPTQDLTRVNNYTGKFGNYSSL